MRETGRWAPGGVAAFFDMLRLRKIAYVHFKWAGVGCSVRMNKNCEALSYPW